MPGSIEQLLDNPQQHEFLVSLFAVDTSGEDEKDDGFYFGVIRDYTKLSNQEKVALLYSALKRPTEQLFANLDSVYLYDDDSLEFIRSILTIHQLYHNTDIQQGDFPSEKAIDHYLKGLGNTLTSHVKAEIKEFVKAGAKEILKNEPITEEQAINLLNDPMSDSLHPEWRFKIGCLPLAQITLNLPNNIQLSPEEVSSFKLLSDHLSLQEFYYLPNSIKALATNDPKQLSSWLAYGKLTPLALNSIKSAQLDKLLALNPIIATTIIDIYDYSLEKLLDEENEEQFSHNIDLLFRIENFIQYFKIPLSDLNGSSIEFLSTISKVDFSLTKNLLFIAGLTIDQIKDLSFAETEDLLDKIEILQDIKAALHQSGEPSLASNKVLKALFYNIDIFNIPQEKLEILISHPLALTELILNSDLPDDKKSITLSQILSLNNPILIKKLLENIKNINNFLALYIGYDEDQAAHHFIKIEPDKLTILLDNSIHLAKFFDKFHSVSLTTVNDIQSELLQVIFNNFEHIENLKISIEEIADLYQDGNLDTLLKNPNFSIYFCHHSFGKNVAEEIIAIPKKIIETITVFPIGFRLFHGVFGLSTKYLIEVYNETNGKIFSFATKIALSIKTDLPTQTLLLLDQLKEQVEQKYFDDSAKLDVFHQFIKKIEDLLLICLEMGADQKIVFDHSIKNPDWIFSNVNFIKDHIKDIVQLTKKPIGIDPSRLLQQSPKFLSFILANKIGIKNILSSQKANIGKIALVFQNPSLHFILTKDNSLMVRRVLKSGVKMNSLLKLEPDELQCVLDEQRQKIESAWGGHRLFTSPKEEEKPSAPSQPIFSRRDYSG